MQNYILASTSPRRQELLSRCQITFTTAKPDYPEEKFWAAKRDLIKGHPLSLHEVKIWAEELALAKAQSVQKQRSSEDLHIENTTIIGADTLIYYAGEILGKPQTPAHAAEILHKLSGQTHQVITAVALLRGNEKTMFHTCSDVSFYALDQELIKAYIETKSPLDKAGAYGIQDMGALFISEIKGDYYSIMGLPVSELYRRLRK